MQFNIARLNLSERDIEDCFFENPTACRHGQYWHIETWIGRQYRLPSGIADLIGITNRGCAAVVEVKNVPADGRAIAQVCRYAYDIKSILEYRWEYRCRDANGPYVQKVVIAPSIESVNVYFEANACDVTLLEFSTSLHLEVYTAYPDTEHDLDRFHEISVSNHDIAQNEEWNVFGAFSLPGDQLHKLMAIQHTHEMLRDDGDTEHF